VRDEVLTRGVICGSSFLKDRWNGLKHELLKRIGTFYRSWNAEVRYREKRLS